MAPDAVRVADDVGPSKGGRSFTRVSDNRSEAVLDTIVERVISSGKLTKAESTEPLCQSLVALQVLFGEALGAAANDRAQALDSALEPHLRGPVSVR